MANEVQLNGLSVVRRDNVIFVALPRAAWRPIEGGCCCAYCSADGSPQPAFWDTLAVMADPAKVPAKSRTADCSWTTHGPDRQGVEPKRDLNESASDARKRTAVIAGAL